VTTPSISPPKKLRLLFFELALVLAGHFLYTAYIKTTDLVILCDGKGYYDYLPATFIYHDYHFGFRNQDIPYAQDNRSHNIVCNGKIINKYSCGLAVLWSPFFVAAHEWAKSSKEVAHNGYSLPYHFAVYMAALAYLLAGLIYLRKLLLLFTHNLFLVQSIQVIVLFATNLYAYVYVESSFTHAYSFTLITMFFYAFLQWYKTSLSRYLYISSILLALIVLVRPFDLLVILFLPFFTGGIRPFYQYIKRSFSEFPRASVTALFLFAALASVQPLIWYIQCGNFFPWTYTQETFRFSQPALWLTLFGFKKGLFIYTPVLLLGLPALFILFRKGKKMQAICLILAWLILHYFIASWEMWWYGGSFGLRPYVDFYVLFAIMILLTLENVRSWIRALVYLFAGVCLCLNLFQVYQYTHKILPPAEMDLEGYKEIFLKADAAQYGGRLAYRSFSRELRERPLMGRYNTISKDTLYTPAGWRELAGIPLQLEQGKWTRINALVELDCTNSGNEIFYCNISDPTGQSLYYEEMSMKTLCGGDESVKSVNYSIEYNASKTGGATLRIGFRQLHRNRLVKSMAIEIFGDYLDRWTH
jgi:hypothetical protein